jgi:hypothetical protein
MIGKGLVTTEEVRIVIARPSLQPLAPCGSVAPLVIDGVWGCLIRRPPCRKIGDTIKRALD